MASEVNQAPAQDAPKAPEESHGINHKEEKSSEQPAVSAEPTKLDEPAAKAVPEGTVAFDRAPQENTPAAGGNLEKESAPPTSGPAPADLANIPTGDIKEDTKPAEVASASTNGDAQKDTAIKDVADEPTDTPVGGQPKRKAEELAATPAADATPADKKAKLDDAADATDAADAAEENLETNGNSQNGEKKVGRPKKGKKEPPAVGKAARRTRSQGPLVA